jgi:hypothetical protein
MNTRKDLLSSNPQVGGSNPSGRAIFSMSYGSNRFHRLL